MEWGETTDVWAAVWSCCAVTTGCNNGLAFWRARFLPDFCCLALLSLALKNRKHSWTPCVSLKYAFLSSSVFTGPLPSERDLSGCGSCWSKHPTARLHFTAIQRRRGVPVCEQQGPLLAPSPADQTCSSITWQSGVTKNWTPCFAIPAVLLEINWGVSFLVIAGVIWRTAWESWKEPLFKIWVSCNCHFPPLQTYLLLKYTGLPGFLRGHQEQIRPCWAVCIGVGVGFTFAVSSADPVKS